MSCGTKNSLWPRSTSFERSGAARIPVTSVPAPAQTSALQVNTHGLHCFLSLERSSALAPKFFINAKLFMPGAESVVVPVYGYNQLRGSDSLLW